MHSNSSCSAPNRTPLCKDNTGHPSNLSGMVLCLPPWFTLAWFLCIIIIPTLLILHSLLPNPSHSLVSHPTNISHLVYSTTSQLISGSPPCQQLLENILTLVRGEFPVHILVFLPRLSCTCNLHYHIFIGVGIFLYIQILWYFQSVCARHIIWCGRSGSSVCGGIVCLEIGIFGPSSYSPSILPTTLNLWWIFHSSASLISGDSAFFICLPIRGQHADESWVQ